MTARSIATGLLAASLTSAAPALATDQPIAATKLVLKRSPGGKETLLFVSKDPAFLFPGFGEADDPATGMPGGATLEIFSQNEGPAALGVPPGAGKPGWSAQVGAFKFTNGLAPGGISPVRAALLKQGKVLRLTAKTAGLPLAGPQGAVGVRITTGTLRNCALFDATTVRRDEANAFVAKSAVATGLADCSNASLGGPTCAESDFIASQCGGTCPPGSACGTRNLSTCFCILAAQPCGDTWPVCNGECAAGEECASTGGFPLPGCACLPVGSISCGQSCAGACPSGLECNFFELSFPGASGCLCGPPGPCGSGGDDCPVGFHCAAGPGIGPLCVPNFCGGGAYPTCAGTCGAGESCVPVDLGGGAFQACACAPTGSACDSACGGLACGSGDVCHVGATCACGPP